MKKSVTLLIAVAIMLGLGQCKKKVETISSVPASVYITLDVNGGEKVIVDLSSDTCATVTFEQGDVIYVGNNGQYCGYLEHDGTGFGGTITPTSGDDTDFLHFYFMGNKGPTDQQPTSVDITDQTAKYPVISYGRSTHLYNSGLTSYSATLYNKCAIMKFDISGVDTDKPITIIGMKNTVTVDFSKNIGSGDPVNPYTYSKTGDGHIVPHAESNTERWAILLPQDEVTTASARTGDYTTRGLFTVPAVSVNGYYDTPVNVKLYFEGKFSVSSRIRVRFSPGNLQATYDGSSWSWAFAPNQWNYIGNAAANTSVTDSYPWISGTGTVDLFGWSTDRESNYFGINSKITNTPYIGNFVDWGTLAIGSDTANTWRTLDRTEWQYLLSRRTDANNKHASATVNDVAGMVLLPDSWTLPEGCAFNPGGNNVYDTVGWALMEASGAVFLPAAGYREEMFVSSGDAGCYWSSSVSSSSAYYVYFDGNYVTMTDSYARYYGKSVRLVR